MPWNTSAIANFAVSVAVPTIFLTVPDLLDWLASDFVDHKYDIKYLLRTILTSRAYQMPAVALAGELELQQQALLQAGAGDAGGVETAHPRQHGAHLVLGPGLAALVAGAADLLHRLAHGAGPLPVALLGSIVGVVKTAFVLEDNVVWGAVSWFCHRPSYKVT